MKTIIFFGSGPVAAASLVNIAAHSDVELVVTKNRPLHHKDPAPVEELAKSLGLPIAFADTKSELEDVIAQQQPASICGVVIDYGVIISQKVIDYFAMGIVNSHFSLLPEWRGADPITFSLLSGQKETGVCLMRIDAGLDTGDIIANTTVEIAKEDTNQTLTEKLIAASDALINALLPSYIDGSIAAIPQPPDAIVTYSRKLTKQDGMLDTNKPASVLEREIRAFSEWPKSKFSINDSLTIIVTKAESVDAAITPGTLQISDDKKLLLGTRVGSLELIELMPLGKQKMNAQAFINGYGSRLQN